MRPPSGVDAGSALYRLSDEANLEVVIHQHDEPRNPALAHLEARVQRFRLESARSVPGSESGLRLVSSYGLGRSG